jgi:hypothetical protein
VTCLAKRSRPAAEVDEVVGHDLASGTRGAQRDEHVSHVVGRVQRTTMARVAREYLGGSAPLLLGRRQQPVTPPPGLDQRQ